MDNNVAEVYELARPGQKHSKKAYLVNYKSFCKHTNKHCHAQRSEATHATKRRKINVTVSPDKTPLTYILSTENIGSVKAGQDKKFWIFNFISSSDSTFLTFIKQRMSGMFWPLGKSRHNPSTDKACSYNVGHFLSTVLSILERCYHNVQHSKPDFSVVERCSDKTLSMAN